MNSDLLARFNHLACVFPVPFVKCLMFTFIWGGRNRLVRGSCVDPVCKVVDGFHFANSDPLQWHSTTVGRVRPGPAMVPGGQSCPGPPPRPGQLPAQTATSGTPVARQSATAPPRNYATSKPTITSVH
ncbi:hypothetical protein QTP70_005286 [Hemibagrus guttatus]|uniref:Uncharacterized protein n=1 Tax=Hemibagrus guttatus TaxID=175788 RepID=A0AAE0Q0S5_9TELE|nr:hypothetical protein QTP70_005286 [Hemibagrus guttatus]